MARNLSRAQAIKIFERDYLPAIKEIESGKIDLPLRSEGWVICVEDLIQSGEVTDDHSTMWEYPECCIKIKPVFKL